MENIQAGLIHFCPRVCLLSVISAISGGVDSSSHLESSLIRNISSTPDFLNGCITYGTGGTPVQTFANMKLCSLLVPVRNLRHTWLFPARQSN